MFEIDPKSLIDWLQSNVPWLVFVVTPLFFLLKWWGKLNWEALNGREKKPESYEWAINQLKANNWGKNYLNALGWLLDKVSGWIGDREKLNQIYVTPAYPKGILNKAFGFNPFTPESYDKCLRMVFLYPILSFFIAWAMGGSGQVGGYEFFGKEAATLEVWQRWVLLGGMVASLAMSFWLLFRWQGRQWLVLILVVLLWSGLTGLVGGDFAKALFVFGVFFGIVFLPMYGAGWLTGLLLYRSVRRSHDAIYRAAFASAVAGAVASSAVASSAVAIAIAIAFAFAFVVAGIIIVLLGAMQQWTDGKGKVGWFWLFYSVVFLALGYVSVRYSPDSKYMVLLLFWLVLPLVNAPLDWLSLGVTRGLLQAARAGHHGGWPALGFGLLDLGFALVFLFLIAAVLVLATALGNVMAGKTLVDLNVMLAQVRANPLDVNEWWVYFMMLSTLVPTLVHFALAGGAATLWLPQKLRERIAHNLEQNHYKISLAWVYLTFTPAVGFVVAPALLLGLLYWLVTVHGGWLGGHLLDWAEWLAALVNPAVGTQP